MRFKFACPHCSATLNAQDEWRGKKATCKSCGEKLMVPLSESAKNEPQKAEDETVKASTPEKTQPENATAAEVVAARQTDSNGLDVNSQEFKSPEPASAAVSVVYESKSDAAVASVMTVQEEPPSGESSHVSVGSETILSSIRGSIAPVQTTLMYRLAVIPVALLMIVLPVVYIALIAGVGYFTCWYAVHGLSFFEGVNPSGGGRNRGLGAVLMYAGPLFASALTFIFLIKPLFARSKGSSAAVVLQPEQQPTLFRFVEQIAKAVHAPKPTSIVVDTEVNASASFRHGLLSLFRRGDLELTIGLPLVERLSAQELAGVLAHEFGHFSQGLGMRLQYIVRSINMWFAQVVYQRDRADQWLANSAGKLDIRLGIVVYFTMFLIWISRRVLWMLMMIGHGFSSILLRQMEYDADQHEIRLAGSKKFVSTANKLPRLSVAYHEAAMQMQHAFADGRLVNHLPALVGMNFDQLSADVLQKLDEHTATEKGSWFDTHPVNRDRIARAEQTASPGIMSLDVPANQLFQDYDGLAKNVTRQFYVEIFEGEFKDSMLTELHQVQALMESSKADYEARVKLLGEEFAVVRPIPLASPENRHEPLQQLLNQSQRLSQQMLANVEAFKANCKSLEELERRWITAFQAMSFQSCGITFKEKVWEGVPVDSQASTQNAADQIQRELGQLHQRLTGFEQLLGARVDTAIQCLWSLRDSERFSATDVRERMFKALAALASQFNCQQDYVSLKRDFNIVAGIFAAVDFGNLSKAQRAEVDKQIARLKETASRICRSVERTAYPFDHSRGEITLAQYLAPNGLKLADMSETCETSAIILQNFDTAYIRSVGVLCDGLLKTEEYLSETPLETLLQDAESLQGGASGSVEAARVAVDRQAVDAVDLVSAAEVVDTNEVVDAAEVVEITNSGTNSLFDFSGNNASTATAPSSIYAAPTEVTMGQGLASGTVAAGQSKAKSRRWIWLLASGAVVLLLLTSIVAAVSYGSRFFAGNSKPKVFAKPSVDPSDFVHSTQRIFLYRWNTELPVTYDLTVALKKNPDEPIAKGTVSFTDLKDSNTEAKDPTEFSTGFVIDAGLVATTASSVLGSSQIAVFDSVRQQFVSANILAVDTEKNVALLTVPLVGRPLLKLNSSDSLASDAPVTVLSVSGAGGPTVAMPGDLSEKPSYIEQESGKQAKLIRSMMASELGSPVVDSQGLVVGMVDVQPSTDVGEKQTGENARIVSSKAIQDLLNFSKIDVSKSGGRSWAKSPSPIQPVVRIRSYQKYPYKRVSASTKLIHSARSQPESYLRSLTVSSLGQMRMQNVADNVPLGLLDYPEMVFVPLDPMNQTQWTTQSAGESRQAPSRNLFNRQTSNPSMFRKQNAHYRVKSRDGDRVQLEGEVVTELGPQDKPTITVKQSTIFEFNLELGIPETVRHEFERRETNGRPLDWIVTFKRIDGEKAN